MKTKDINERIEYGLESIDSEEQVEVKLKDLMLIYKTFEEFNNFFHQPEHFENSKEVQEYMGDVNFGAYSIINKLYYDVIWNYLPKEIQLQIEKGGEPFESPNKPYYFDSQSKG